MEEEFYLKIYLFRPNRVPPIKIARNSKLKITIETMDYTIPVGSTASAFAKGAFSVKIYTQKCTVDGNRVSFTPEPGFFVQGRNILQYEIGDSVIPLAIDVNCEISLPDVGEATKPDSVKPYVQRAEEAAEKSEAAAASAQEVKDSIPKDYTELSDGVSQLKGDLDNIQNATPNDVGKALKAKTVTDGKVTEWEFGESVASNIKTVQIINNLFDYANVDVYTATAKNYNITVPPNKDGLGDATVQIFTVEEGKTYCGYCRLINGPNCYIYYLDDSDNVINELAGDINKVLKQASYIQDTTVSDVVAEFTVPIGYGVKKACIYGRNINELKTAYPSDSVLNNNRLFVFEIDKKDTIQRKFVVDICERIMRTETSPIFYGEIHKEMLNSKLMNFTAIYAPSLDKYNRYCSFDNNPEKTASKILDSFNSDWILDNTVISDVGTAIMNGSATAIYPNRYDSDCQIISADITIESADTVVGVTKYYYSSKNSPGESGTLCCIDSVNHQIAIKHTGKGAVVNTKAESPMQIEVGHTYRLTSVKNYKTVSLTVYDLSTGKTAKCTYTTSSNMCDRGQFGIQQLSGSSEVKYFMAKVPHRSFSKMLILGDSITEEVYSYDVKRWTESVRRWMNNDCIISGIGGTASKDAYDRLISFTMWDYSCKYVVWATGINDMWGSFDIWKKWTEMAAYLCDKVGTILILVVPPVPDSGSSYLNADKFKIYTDIRDYVVSSGRPYIRFDICTSVDGDGITQNKELFYDYLHPNNDGCVIMGDEAVSQLTGLIT